MIVTKAKKVYSAAKALSAISLQETGHRLKAYSKRSFPTQHKIEITPPPDRWAILSLGFSICIDAIGVIITLIPLFGFIMKLLWSPISSFLLHRMYQNQMLTYINLVEELVPVISFIPTATVGWAYTYSEYLPTWIYVYTSYLIRILFKKAAEGVHRVYDKTNTNLSSTSKQQARA